MRCIHDAIGQAIEKDIDAVLEHPGSLRHCDSPSGRNRGTVWASFDGGKTWPLKRLVHEGGFAYSSLGAGRPKTKSEGWVYLHFESGGSKVARFNLSWLLKGDKTGDGEVPKRFSK